MVAWIGDMVVDTEDDAGSRAELFVDCKSGDEKLTSLYG